VGSRAIHLCLLRRASAASCLSLMPQPCHAEYAPGHARRGTRAGLANAHLRYVAGQRRCWVAREDATGRRANWIENGKSERQAGRGAAALRTLARHYTLPVMRGISAALLPRM